MLTLTVSEPATGNKKKSYLLRISNKKSPYRINQVFKNVLQLKLCELA